MLVKININFVGKVKVFNHDYGLKEEDFYSITLVPFLNKKEFSEIEVIFSKKIDAKVKFVIPPDATEKYSVFCDLSIIGDFSCEIQDEELKKLFLDKTINEAIVFKSMNVNIIQDLNAKNTWDQTRALILKESAGFQKIKAKVSI